MLVSGALVVTASVVASPPPGVQAHKSTETNIKIISKTDLFINRAPFKIKVANADGSKPSAFIGHSALASEPKSRRIFSENT